jgi:hypothetical protein
MEDRAVNENTTPRRRSLRRLWLVLGIVLAVFVAVFLGIRTSFFARAAGRIVSNRFLGGTSFVFSVDRIGGSIIQDVTLQGVRVRYAGRGPSFDLFRAEEISIRYGWRSLARRSGTIDGISMIEPVLSFRTDSTGAFILPSFGEGTGELPSLDVDRFTIENARLFVQGKQKSEEIDEMNLVGSVRVRATEITVAFAQGSAADAGRNFSMRSLKGAVTLAREPRRQGASAPGASRIILDSLAVVLDESALTASGTIVPSTKLFDLAVEARPFNIEEITRILQIETSHYGDFRGSFTARGTTTRFRLDGIANGVVSGYALKDFGVNLLRDGRTIRLDSLDGVVNDARIQGRGSYTLDKPDILTLDVDARGLDLSKGFVPGKKLPETRFNGAVNLRYNVRDEALAFTLDLDAGDFLGFPFSQATMRGSYANDSLKADEIVIIHPTHTIRGNGTFVGTDRVSFVFDGECAARDTIFAYFNIEQYRADATLNGRWEGTLDEWDLRLNGSCANLAYYGAFVPAGAVKLAVQKNAEYAAQFDLDGPGCSIGPVKFAAFSLSLDARGSTGTIKKLHLSREDVTADITADFETKGRDATVRFKECSLDALGETWLGGGAFTVYVGDSLVRFEDIQLHSKAGAAYVDGAFGRLSKTARGRFAFERLDLDVLDRAGLLKTPVAGKARGTILCSGAYTDPELDVDIAVEGGRIDTFVVDTLRLKARYARGGYEIDSLVVGSPSGSVDLGGRISGMPIRAAVTDAGAALKHASVAIQSSCRNLDLVPLLSFAGITAVSGGRLNGSISITDSLAHPLVSLKGRINRLAVPAFTIPSVECDVAIDRDEVTARGTLNISPTQQAEFQGSAPLAPARFLYALDRSGPVDLEFTIPEGDFAGLSGVTELVAEPAGRYAGRLAVTGTIASPHLKGDLQLKGASFRISGMEEKYSQVNATITIADSLVTITQLDAREGKKGTIGCAGTISLSGWKPKEYRITCDANEFVIASLGDILANVSGKVSIGTSVEGGRPIPEITGSCRINESELYYDLGSFSASPEAGTLELPSYIVSIDLAIPGNTWIRTPDARVELQGNVTLHHDAKGTYLRGELNLVRGWYNIYGNKFTITSGQLQFVFAGSFRPVVDIEAETQDPEGRKIYLTLQWHQDDLQPKLSLRHEDPGYSETDIWKMLGGGVVAAEGEGTSWNARNTAQSLAANYIERVLNSQMEGVTIELESGRSSSDLTGAGDYTDTKIAIGKYLSQGLYVKYKQGLSISTARQIEVEYRISNLFLIRSEVIRYSEQAIQGNSPGTSDEINVDLKLRWEF